jgi:cytochrome c oxidase subunit 2
MGCVACHSTSGIRLTGPPLDGIFGKEVTVTTGGSERTLTVDEEYIRRSVMDPNADVVEGFNANLMQSFSDLLTEEDISNIIEFIKSMQ